MSAAEFRSREEAWLAKVATTQSAWTTGRAALDAIVRRAMPDPGPISCHRIHAGVSNETYVCDVTRERVVVRIARGTEPRFAQERWAIEMARSRGVPAPEILLIVHEPSDAGVMSFCVERHLPGIALGALARRRGPDDGLVTAALRSAGRLLAAIHDVPARGYGPLDATGTGALLSWTEFLDRNHGTLQAGQPPEVERALLALAAERAFLTATPSRLLHFDFEPGHILLDEGTGEITGILDLEEAHGGDPAYDFAQWDVFHDVYAPVDPLVLGYLEHGGHALEFARRRLLSEIHMRVRELVRGSVPPQFIGDARTRLARALEALG